MTRKSASSNSDVAGKYSESEGNGKGKGKSVAFGAVEVNLIEKQAADPTLRYICHKLGAKSAVWLNNFVQDNQDPTGRLLVDGVSVSC